MPGHRLLISIMMATTLVGISGTPALAADTLAEDSSSATPVIAAVVITGSRISVSANLTLTNPIGAISGRAIPLQVYTDVTDVINTPPQNFINAAVEFGNHSNPWPRRTELRRRICAGSHRSACRCW
jgi:predicted secreted protein